MGQGTTGQGTIEETLAATERRQAELAEQIASAEAEVQKAIAAEGDAKGGLARGTVTLTAWGEVEAARRRAEGRLAVLREAAEILEADHTAARAALAVEAARAETAKHVRDSAGIRTEAEGLVHAFAEQLVAAVQAGALARRREIAASLARDYARAPQLGPLTVHDLAAAVGAAWARTLPSDARRNLTEAHARDATMVQWVLEILAGPPSLRTAGSGWRGRVRDGLGVTF